MPNYHTQKAATEKQKQSFHLSAASGLLDLSSTTHAHVLTSQKMLVPAKLLECSLAVSILLQVHQESRNRWLTDLHQSEALQNSETALSVFIFWQFLEPSRCTAMHGARNSFDTPACTKFEGGISISESIRKTNQTGHTSFGSSSFGAASTLDSAFGALRWWLWEILYGEYGEYV